MYSQSTHYNDVIISAIASHITSLYSDADQRKHQSSASLAFVWGIHRGQVNSPRKWPVTRKMLPFDDVIMYSKCETITINSKYAAVDAMSKQTSTTRPGAHFTNDFLHRNSNSMENYFCSHLSYNEVVAMNFCLWYVTCAVVPCAKSCNDVIHTMELH